MHQPPCMKTPFVKVNAIVRLESVERVEAALQAVQVRGVSVTRVDGYGEYVDFFARDWMASHARFEVFTSAERAPAIVDAILAAASSGTRGDGIVCVVPVEQVWRVRSRSLASPQDL